MAILQISRLQHRRGLQQDLPQLASAELGWSIDQRRLFIGNGTISEGAPIEGVTEILTQHTDLVDIIKFYTYKGASAGFTSLSGPSTTAPTVRTLQSKLDDFISVRDFGAVGDGATNDLDAIYRAIAETYKSTEVFANTRARRTIYLPGGTYNIAPTAAHPDGMLRIPPWAHLVGDGIDSTRIIQIDTAVPYVAQFSDSDFVVGPSMGATQFITLPQSASMENLALVRYDGKDVLSIDSGVNLNFKSVKFDSGYNWQTVPTASTGGIKFGSSKNPSSNITFDLCRFSNLNRGIISSVALDNVRFDSCTFENLYKGAELTGSDSASSPSVVRFTNSKFKNLASLALDCGLYVTGIVSAGNAFYAVNGGSTAINYLGDGNYSLNDVFDVAESTRINYNNSKTVQLQANIGLTLGTYSIGTGGLVSLNHAATPTTTGITLPSTGTMQYQIGTNIRGTLTFTMTDFLDDIITPAGVSNPVTFTINNSTLMYTNTSNSTVSLRYSIDHF